jgi:hypothetical protein
MHMKRNVSISVFPGTYDDDISSDGSDNTEP